MSIGAFVNEIVRSPEHPILIEVLQCVPKEEAIEYQYTFASVAKFLKQAMQDDSDKAGFDTRYLKRVIKYFSEDIAEQTRQRQILEAVLRYAKRNNNLKSVKIPQLIKLNRDLPALNPTALMFTKRALEVYDLIKADLAYPEKLNSRQLELGRLLTVLYLFEGLPDLATVSQVVRKFRLYYAGNIIYLEDSEDTNKQTRFVIQLYTALLIQLIRRYEKIDPILERASRSSKMSMDYIQKYLRVISKKSNLKISLSQLSHYRNIYWIAQYSPVETMFFLQRMKSALLPTDIFHRTLLNKSYSTLEAGLASKVDPEINKTRNTIQAFQSQDVTNYKQIEHSINLIKLLIAELKKQKESADDKKQSDLQNTSELTHNKKKPHQAIITRIVKKLRTPEYSQNFYVLLFGNYIINLLKNGGSRKNLLSFRTIHDYVSAPLRAFITVFSDLDLLKLDEGILTEKLNCVAELMAPTKRGVLYYLAEYIQQLDLVADFMAANLDFVVQSGRAHADIISVAQIEHLLLFLKVAGESYTDAILLLCLGFYSGTRRSEAKFIRICDFEMVQSGNGTRVSLRIVPTRERTIKSKAGTRTINLNVFWPKQWLEILICKLQLAQAAGYSKTTCLFDKSVDQHFALISQLLRAYLDDKCFTYHNLRHSFVCWQYYRLVLQPRLKGIRAENIACLDHEYFSDAACSLARSQLGLPVISRRAIFTLCALVGHSEPSVTFSSYQHLRDLYSYLLISSELCITQKALSRLLIRAKLDSELVLRFPLEAIHFGSAYDKQTLTILPAPEIKHSRLLNLQELELHSITVLPCLRQIECGLRVLGKIQPDEITSVEHDETVITIEGSWLTKLNEVCDEVHRHYPARSAKLPKIPEIARSKAQLRSDKPLSKSRKIFESLQAKTQLLLDSKQWCDKRIFDVLQVLKGLLIKQGWTIQFREPEPFEQFLALCREILPSNIIPKVIFHFIESENMAKDIRWFLTSWDRTFANYDIKPELKPCYWVNALEQGVVWLYFEDTGENKDNDSSGKRKLRQQPQRVSSVMKFMHFLLVAIQTRLYLRGNDQQE
ncbi:hypothetical protein [Rheinheimera oceanensis]|uniref:hypothetical protein n=1 Tax=Rheinheimera oceanensis TaxID=2817449 RepID=UPI001BFD0AD1|nr:hypothetical protein [Rheinheimera oceanensis]